MHPLLSLRSRAQELQLLSPRATATKAWVPRARAPQQEKPLQWEAPTPQLESSPCLPQVEKNLYSKANTAKNK